METFAIRTAFRTKRATNYPIPFLRMYCPLIHRFRFIDRYHQCGIHIPTIHIQPSRSEQSLVLEESYQWIWLYDSRNGS